MNLAQRVQRVADDRFRLQCLVHDLNDQIEELKSSGSSARAYEALQTEIETLRFANTQLLQDAVSDLNRINALGAAVTRYERVVAAVQAVDVPVREAYPNEGNWLGACAEWKLHQEILHNTLADITVLDGPPVELAEVLRCGLRVTLGIDQPYWEKAGV